ncbi:MAG: hypothetical protein P8J53_04085 [Alphaproteobacteria bacterium]|jgi:hypothetical protein|nr:hypothetical protein [Alphaproteobacteria bacterium]
MRNFTLKLSKSYNFEIKIEANSIQEAKKIVLDTPLEKVITGCDFDKPELIINDIVCNDLDPRFYSDDNKLR